MEGDELLFELRGPDGHVWRLYLDGRAEGFPPGTLVCNFAFPLACAHAALPQSRINSLYQALQEAEVKIRRATGVPLNIEPTATIASSAAEARLSSEASQSRQSCQPLTPPQGGREVHEVRPRTLAEKIALIHLVSEQCRLLGLRLPMWSDWDEILK